MSESIWVVDRVGPKTVTLVADGTGTSRDVQRRALSQATRSMGRAVEEGDVLRVPLGPSGELDWKAAVVDERLRQERLDEARAALDRLRRRDPGGDVEL